MKSLIIFAFSFMATSAFAIQDYKFNCDLGSFTVESIPGIQKAPESPVVGLNIKVLKEQVPLFLMKAKSSTGVEKDLFITDWTNPTKLSQEGLDLLDLLSFFFTIDTNNIDSLRAGIPTNLLDTFAYIEIKDLQGKVLKLGFDGTNPSECQ